MISNSITGDSTGLSARRRWLIHTAILCVPVLLAVFTACIGREMKLPQTGFHLFRFLTMELLVWGLAFAAAFRISGVTARELCLVVSGPLKTLALGVVWFVAARVGTMLILYPQMRLIPPNSVWGGVERVFDMMGAQNIAKHPMFSCTVYAIAAVLAGATEEMWRVGMLRGLEGLFPSLKNTRWGAVVCITVVALIFGIAHVYLGWIGVENAVLIGLLFGFVVMYRRSYWETAIAHALFDSFAFAGVVYMALNPQTLTPMIIASAAQGDIPRITHVLKLGGNINGTYGVTKVTPLQMALYYKADKAVPFLLDRGADPNEVDAHGKSPLMVAAERGDTESIQLLLDNGAHVNATNNSGQTALTLARKYRQQAAAELIEKNGGE